MITRGGIWCSIIDFLFDCPHARTTFPRRRRDRCGHYTWPVRHYVACLKCGREIPHRLFDPGEGTKPQRPLRNAEEANV